MMKFRAEYLNQDDEYTLAQLVRIAKLEGAVKVQYRGEEKAETTDLTHEGIVALCDGMEEDFVLRFLNDKGEKLGSFAIILGNQDFTTVCDWTYNDWSNKIGKAIGELYDNPPFDTPRMLGY